jgi:hypothetical protein
MLPERVAVVFSNSHDANFASWQFFTYQNALWLLQNVHDTKFQVVDVSRLPQRVVVVLSLIERFRTLSVTNIPRNWEFGCFVKTSKFRGASVRQSLMLGW